jgi:hypothetical protein
VPRNTRLSRFHYLHFFEWKALAQNAALPSWTNPQRLGSS